MKSGLLFTFLFLGPVPALAQDQEAVNLTVRTTFFGGNGTDRVQGVAVDSQGLVYVVGNTTSTNLGTGLSAAAGGYDKSFNGELDGFAAILSADLSKVIAWTYLGGSGEDRGYGVAVDGQGRAHVVGFTTSTNFPKTTGPSLSGGRDVFVVRLSSDMKTLEMARLVGGNDDENTRDAVCLDAAGNIFISGVSGSSDFPTTAGVFQKNHATGGPAGNWDGFVAKLSPAGSIVWATYLGGSGWDALYSGVRVGKDGTVFAAGCSTSPNLGTQGAFQKTYGGAPINTKSTGDGLVARFSADGKKLLFCTYLGGSQHDMVAGNDALELDSQDRPIVIGQTKSTTFPTTAGAFDRSPNGAQPHDGFVAILSKDGGTLVACTLLGGTAFEELSGLALDGTGKVILSGNVTSPDYPVTADALQKMYRGGVGDAIVTKLAPDLSVLVYSSYLGGSGSSGYGDRGRCLAFWNGTVVISGDTDSPNFPVTAGAAIETYRGGPADGWVSVQTLPIRPR